MTVAVAIEKKLGDFKVAADFATETGRLTVLFGRSGAGKTAIVDMIAGLMRPDRGRIAVDGRVLFDAGGGTDLPVERRRIGYVFQESRLFPHMSVRRNLTYGRRFAAKPEAVPPLDRVVDLLGIEHLLARRPRTLSAGERQRVAIGRALLRGPELLLMDEPLANLDAARKSEILPYIERLRDEAGLPIVYVSHAVEEVVRLADTVVVINDGAVAAVGPVDEVMGRLDLHPLTGRHEAGAVIEATVQSQDEAYGLTALAFPGGQLHVPRVDLPIGTAIRARIRARDVSVALKPPEQVSILNVFRGTVTDVGDADGPIVDLRLDIGVPLWARITARSRADLKIEPGQTVYALVKAIALDHRSLGLRESKKRE